MQNMLLKLQFIDRAGRFVYHVHPLEAVQVAEDQPPQMSEGPVIGVIRTKPLDETIATEIEWCSPPEPEPVIDEARKVGPDFLPGRMPKPEEPGPHGGGTG